MMGWLARFFESCLDFSNILNTSITASWLILVVLVLRMLFKKAPKWMHVALWGLVAVRLLFPFSIESSFSLVPSTETIPKEILRYEGNQLREPAYLDVVTNPMISEKVTVELEQSVDRVQINTMYMSFIWWGGISVMLLYTAVSYWDLRKRVQTAVRLRENIFQSESVGAPFVLGIIRPRIYMPYKISEQDMPHVIAHEMTHIRRKDHWWKPLGFLLLTFHWFNPLMWVAYILLCRDIELACDESVIKKLGHDERADYSQALLSCSVNRKVIAACPLAFGEVGVKERVKNVLYYKKPAFWVVLAALLAGVTVGVCFLTNPVTGTDSLKALGYENYNDGYSDFYIANFEANLGDEVKSGKLYVEQWHNGECVQSIPGVLTQDLSHIYINISVSYRSSLGYNVSHGSVMISTNEYGGDWTHYFDFPEGESVKRWSYESFDEGHELKTEPGEEKILCAMAFDNGSGVRVFDCDTLISDPQRLEEAEHMIVVRAVFDSEPIEEQPDAAASPLKMKVFQLDDAITLEDEVRKAAYISALEKLIYQKISPEGEEWIQGSMKFAIFDIDSDGVEELIIEQDDLSMAGMKTVIYDYDEESDTLWKEFDAFPTLTFYENGIIKADAPYNRGVAAMAEDFWPYSLYRYNEAADDYGLVAHVDGWKKASGRETYEGMPFPEEVDDDGDGMVYYVTEGERYVYENPIDNEAYNAWWDSVIGDAPKINNIHYMDLPVVMPTAPG